MSGLARIFFVAWHHQVTHQQSTFCQILLSRTGLPTGLCISLMTVPVACEYFVPSSEYFATHASFQCLKSGMWMSVTPSSSRRLFSESYAHQRQSKTHLRNERRGLRNLRSYMLWRHAVDRGHLCFMLKRVGCGSTVPGRLDPRVDAVGSREK